jgi:hypothetical protein
MVYLEFMWNTLIIYKLFFLEIPIIWFISNNYVGFLVHRELHIVVANP